MSEIRSLSAEERAELERLRSEVATLRSQVQAGEPSRPVRGPPSGGGSGGGTTWPPCASGLAAVAPPDWSKGSTWLLERASQRQVHAHYLAPLALGGRVEIGQRRPVRSPTAG
jgi:hypothetical protein